MLGGCQGFQPEDVPEGVAYTQEKLGTALSAISTAYDLGAISQDRKNALLDDWQKAKDVSDAAILSYMAGNGSVELGNATVVVRSLINQLVLIGLLEEE